VIEEFMAARRLPDVTVAADAGMISEANQKAIEAAGLSFILGMKVPHVPDAVARWRREHPGRHPVNQARLAPAAGTSTLSGAPALTQARLACGESASISAVRLDRRRPVFVGWARPGSYFLILVWTVAVLLRVRGREHQICPPAAHPPARRGRGHKT
jgi:hypothetical protein